MVFQPSTITSIHHVSVLIPIIIRELCNWSLQLMEVHGPKRSVIRGCFFFYGKSLMYM